MNVKILFLSFLFVLPVYANKSLLLVKKLGDVKYDVPVLTIINKNNFIVLADQKTTNILKQKQFEVTVLDSNVEEKKYFLVCPYNEVPGEEIDYSVKILKKYGTVLADFENICLMISDADILHSMKEYRVDIVRLFLDPMNFSCNTLLESGKRGIRFNPALQSMLDKVDPDTVEAYQRKLVSFETRHVQSKCSKKEFIPWLAEFYKNHGCDTILKFPLESGAFEIVGVRYGVKERTLNNVIIIGGHADIIISGASADTPHQGANDNTTGQVAVMEACRVHSYFSFDKTILYAAHNGEEKGLWGSRAIARWLKNNNIKTYGGIFSYDMFGMEAGSRGLTFSVWTGVDGSQTKEAQAFVDMMVDLKEKYELRQPQKIQTIFSRPQYSDFWSYHNVGYLCLSHNYSTAGAGQIHTADDAMKDTYDKVYQAECSKMGIITTAQYAGISRTEIMKQENILYNPFFNYLQTVEKIVFTFGKSEGVQPGKIEVFNIQGQLLRSFKTNHSENLIVWDGRNNRGIKIAAQSVLVVKYSNPLTTSSFKIVMR